MLKDKIMFLLCLFVLFINTSCEYADNRLKVYNKSSEDIVIEVYLDSLPKVKNSKYADFYKDNVIKKGEIKNIRRLGKTAWLSIFSQSKNSKLNIAVFSIDSLVKYNEIDSLIKNKRYKMYEVTEKELKENNWLVIIY